MANNHLARLACLVGLHLAVTGDKHKRQQPQPGKPNKKFEDYLDSQITANDMYFLEDVEIARQLVELGIRGNGEVLRREEFTQRKEAAEAARLARLHKQPKALASQGRCLDGLPLLQALQEREEAVRNGKLATIVFIRDRNAKGQEVSGYIDYGHRLATESWEPVFDQVKRLLPRSDDLSYFNWDTKVCTSTPTQNFQVTASDTRGLRFTHKRDRKVLCVARGADPGDNSVRTELATAEYAQVVLFDHVTRRRG